MVIGKYFKYGMVEENVQSERFFWLEDQVNELVIDIHIRTRVGAMDSKLLLPRLINDAGLILAINGCAQDDTRFSFQIRWKL